MACLAMDGVPGDGDCVLFHEPDVAKENGAKKYCIRGQMTWA